MPSHSDLPPEDESELDTLLLSNYIELPPESEQEVTGSDWDLHQARIQIAALEARIDRSKDNVQVGAFIPIICLASVGLISLGMDGNSLAFLGSSFGIAIVGWWMAGRLASKLIYE